jgi:RNA polymerase sigma-70 factor (ECF subfamily)
MQILRMIPSGIAAHSKQVMRSPLENDTEFSQFFHEHYNALVLFAFRFTDELAAAEDIATESFVMLWRKRDSLGIVKSFRSYLYAITRNASLDWLRINKREKTQYRIAASLEPASEATVLEEMIHFESMKGIMTAMERLPKQCRKVFVLHYLEGKKLSEIAKELKISIGTVYTHKYRSIDLLQKALLGLFLAFFRGI